MEKFLAGNEWQWRLARTIVQGVLGVFVANIDLIIGFGVLDPTMRALVVAFVMAILSPIMAAGLNSIDINSWQEDLVASKMATATS